jgi:hypothetical protein
MTQTGNQSLARQTELRNFQLEVAQRTEVEPKIVCVVSPIKDKSFTPPLEDHLLRCALQDNTARLIPLVLDEKTRVPLLLDVLRQDQLEAVLSTAVTKSRVDEVADLLRCDGQVCNRC